MEIKEIIANVVTIITLIDDLGDTDIENIKNRTNLDSVNIGLALGWLIRGSNIHIYNEAGILRISNMY